MEELINCNGEWIDQLLLCRKTQMFYNPTIPRLQSLHHHHHHHDHYYYNDHDNYDHYHDKYHNHEHI